MKRPDELQIKEALKRLEKRFSGPGAMEIGEAYHALVAVMLSARTRDEQVLKLLPGFFDAFPDVATLAVAKEADIRSRINTIGMYKQKAKNLKKLAERVVAVYAGKIPDTMEDLTSLAGVGRKTASVVLPYAFGTSAIAVDTHVHRVTNRLGWVQAKTPEKTETALLDTIPPRLRRSVNRVFVKHGRYICITKPRCWACPLADVCAYKSKNVVPPKNADAILEDVARREEVLQRLREVVNDHI